MYEIKIGQVLKKTLRARGMKLKEVSRATGIPYSTLHTWYENRQPKNILKAQRLADYLGLTLQELLFDQIGPPIRASASEIPRSSFDEYFAGKFEIIVRRLDD